MAKYTAPKAIANHPGVAECESAVEGGAPDYRHDVLLRCGWQFKRGRTAGGRTLFCKTVADFLMAEPVQVETCTAEPR